MKTKIIIKPWYVNKTKRMNIYIVKDNENDTTYILPKRRAFKIFNELSKRRLIQKTRVKGKNLIGYKKL